MRIAVLGVGLIGGSIGLAARRAGHHVVGYDRDGGAEALARGALDEVAPGALEAVGGADAVFVAVPVGTVADVVSAALAGAAKDTLITDVGSTKRAVVAAAGGDERFVGGHPLAGAEFSGVEHARADLFDGAVWYLTPVAETSGMLLDRLFRLLRELGARPCAIDPDVHDRLLAAVSHLPHVVANVLVTGAAGALGEGEGVPAVGPSVRDATRVAGAPGTIWTDIYLSNADAVVGVLDEAIARLRGVRDALASGDREWIADWNEAAARDRRRLLERELVGGELCELRASVPNRPGVVAAVALALGRGGVNIADMGLHPAPDMSEGVVAVWVSGREAARRAAELIGELGFPVVVR